MKKLFLIFILLSEFVIDSKADNTGQINGTVADSITGEPLIGANIYVMLNGSPFGTITNMDGYYVLKPLQPGLYDVRISYVGYSETTITGVIVSQGSIKIQNVRLSQSVNLPPIVIKAERDIITTICSLPPITEEIIRTSAVRGTVDLIATLPGFYQSDEGGELYFRGSRPESTEYYVDDVKIVGEYNVPSGSIAEIIVYSGGIPARYGDVTGGVVVITTKSYNMYRNRFD